ncbi:MAG: hypothetical protein HY301_14795 [Verrucomicrobia bacterium]|nr:hypothetical protein [Verrucomicrobiota bacterium]
MFTAAASRPGAGVKTGPVTLLDEKLLRITMLLDVINPLPAAPGAPAK